MAEHAELLETAFVSYLSQFTGDLDSLAEGAEVPAEWTWPNSLKPDGTLRIFPGESNLEKDGQHIVAYVTDLTEEPPFSGNRWADVVVQLTTPTTQDAAADPDTALNDHKAAAATLASAIADDTILGVLNQTAGLYVYSITEKNPMRAQDETGWASGFKLRVYSTANGL